MEHIKKHWNDYAWKCLGYDKSETINDEKKTQ